METTSFRNLRLTFSKNDILASMSFLLEDTNFTYS